MKNEDILAGLLALHGVKLEPGRAAKAAQVIAGQLAAEREATRALAFELEPAAFTGELDK